MNPKARTTLLAAIPPSLPAPAIPAPTAKEAPPTALAQLSQTLEQAETCLLTAVLAEGGVSTADADDCLQAIRRAKAALWDAEIALSEIPSNPPAPGPQVDKIATIHSIAVQHHARGKSIDPVRILRIIEQWPENNDPAPASPDSPTGGL